MPKVILIPGQVETDASVITSGCGYDSLKLLQEVRRMNPLSFIIFKIHPDVLFSSRQGIANRKELLKFADYVCSDNTPITTLIELADEVHTISSLSGFDALIRGKKSIYLWHAILRWLGVNHRSSCLYSSNSQAYT